MFGFKKKKTKRKEQTNSLKRIMEELKINNEYYNFNEVKETLRAIILDFMFTYKETRELIPLGLIAPNKELNMNKELENKTIQVIRKYSAYIHESHIKKIATKLKLETDEERHQNAFVNKDNYIYVQNITKLNNITRVIHKKYILENKDLKVLSLLKEYDSDYNVLNIIYLEKTINKKNKTTNKITKKLNDSKEVEKEIIII